ncbi:hypothetical protein [Natronococcus jeotgali]|uniref:Uncharacterized protein n=1 Tax=Natronococcus jeotgali DSM 18795 TaxID=1227498 RepID=L9XW29_9EURY|nr:hypothetical protein [Natronococcus jeotgali]ELY66014.1 hypothetical protein C492_02382 [Natronococcus jeotgali DSM 18795]
MSFDRLRRRAAAVRSRWTGLERDWQSVAVGAATVATVAVFELQIPW